MRVAIEARIAMAHCARCRAVSEDRRPSQGRTAGDPARLSVKRGSAAVVERDPYVDKVKCVPGGHARASACRQDRRGSTGIRCARGPPRRSISAACGSLIRHGRTRPMRREKNSESHGSSSQRCAHARSRPTPRQLAANGVRRPLHHPEVHAREILADDADREQLRAGEERNERREKRKSRDVLP